MKLLSLVTLVLMLGGCASVSPGFNARVRDGMRAGSVKPGASFDEVRAVLNEPFEEDAAVRFSRDGVNVLIWSPSAPAMYRNFTFEFHDDRLYSWWLR